MDHRIASVGRPRSPQSGMAFRNQHKVGSNTWVPGLYVASLLTLQLSAGLLSAWHFSPILFLGITITLLGMISTVPKNTPRDANKIYKPVFTVSISVTIIILISSTYTFFYSSSTASQAAISAVIYFFFILICLLLLVLDGRNRYGMQAPKQLVEYFYSASIIYCFLQMMMLLVDIRNPLADVLPQIDREAVFAKYIGWNSFRQILPISSGFQSGAAIPLSTCIIATAHIIYKKFSKKDILALSMGMYLLLILDARQFILAVFFTAAASFLIRSSQKFALLCVASGWTYPLFTAFGKDLFPFLADLADARKATIYGLFSGREFIWKTFWSYFQNADASQIMIGNGSFGQRISRLSEKYAVLFALWPADTRYLAMLHNSYLQIITDSGILGLMFYMSLMGYASYRTHYLASIQKSDRIAWGSAAMIMMAICFVGSSEVIYTIYMKESLPVIIFFILIVAFFSGAPSSYKIGNPANRRGKAMRLNRKTVLDKR